MLGKIMLKMKINQVFAFFLFNFVSFFHFLSFISVKPFFKVEPMDAMALVGQRVQFMCAVDGDPTPQILWSKENGHIPVGRAEILEEDRSLVIRSVVPSDQGLYICEAHNTVGQISAKAQLIVNCK